MTLLSAFVRLPVLAGGVLSGVGIVAMMGVMAWEVFCRYVLGAPTYWALEISTYLLVASTCLGLGYTLRTNSHVAVEVAVQRMPEPLRRLCQRIVMLLVIGFSLVMLVYGTQQVLSALHYGERSLTPLAMPMAVTVSAVPAGAVLLLLQAVEFLMKPPIESGASELDLVAHTGRPAEKDSPE